MDLPLWDVLWCVALLGEFVVDESEFAALLAGGDSVQADVELGTVVRVRVPARYVLRWCECQNRVFLLGMGVELTKLVSGSLLGAGEPVVCL